MGDLKKRKPIIALFLSFITPGLGQMYNGQIKKGIVFYLVALSLTILLHTFSGSFYKFYGLLLFLVTIIALIGFLLFTLLDALFGAVKLKKTILKPYNKWYFYFAIFVFACLIENIIWPSFSDIQKSFKAYKIPASSMEPTLLVGDHFIVDTKTYKNEKPKRGDIIIFEYPKDPSKEFVKRVIGIEGEKIEIIRNKIYINDQLIDDPWGHFAMPGSSIEDYGPVRTPEGSLFVMGDNRDNSQDSRFWGFVNIEKVKGKALWLYWAKNKTRIGMEIK